MTAKTNEKNGIHNERNFWTEIYKIKKAKKPYSGDIVRELRRYVSKNGHFTLVEVISSEGDHIKITV